MEQKDVKGSYSVSFVKCLWCALLVESLESLTIVGVACCTIGLPYAQCAILSHSLAFVFKVELHKGGGTLDTRLTTLAILVL